MVRAVVGFPGAVIIAFVFYFIVVLYIAYFEPGIESEIVFQRMYIIGFGRIDVNEPGNIAKQGQLAQGISAIAIIDSSEKVCFGVVVIADIIQVGGEFTAC